MTEGVFIDRDGNPIVMAELGLPPGSETEQYPLAAFEEQGYYYIRAVWHFAETYADNVNMSEYEKDQFIKLFPFLFHHGFFVLEVEDIGDSMEIHAGIWGPVTKRYINPNNPEIMGDVLWFSDLLFYQMNMN